MLTSKVLLQPMLVLPHYPACASFGSQVFDCGTINVFLGPSCEPVRSGFGPTLGPTLTPFISILVLLVLLKVGCAYMCATVQCLRVSSIGKFGDSVRPLGPVGPKAIPLPFSSPVFGPRTSAGIAALR
jgi:hypothetical protein